MMPPALILRITVCLAIAAPAIGLRMTGIHTVPVLDMLIFGAAVVAAAFLLAWAAEAAQKDISGALAIAILALIATTPAERLDDAMLSNGTGSEMDRKYRGPAGK